MRRRLLRWGRTHFRKFPWRFDRDPYRTLITEVLLRQTRATDVEDVRTSFLRAYPTIDSLAAASAVEVSARIQRLGFGNQRGPQLVGLARSIAAIGRIPSRALTLRRLPGVGHYTASAVASFAFGRKEPALDVNVARILSRVLDIHPARGELRKNRAVAAAARRLLDGRHPRELNWALLDLGASVCKPRPVCSVCPLRPRCAYGQRQLESMAK
jgi:A/G-specific adenine glycosylase